MSTQRLWMSEPPQKAVPWSRCILTATCQGNWCGWASSPFTIWGSMMEAAPSATCSSNGFHVYLDALAYRPTDKRSVSRPIWNPLDIRSFVSGPVICSTFTGQPALRPLLEATAAYLGGDHDRDEESSPHGDEGIVTLTARGVGPRL